MTTMTLPASGTQETLPHQNFEGHTDCVNRVIHIPGGKKIITCSADGSLRVWNLKTGKQIGYWRDGEDPVNVIALSPDGKKVVSGSRDGAVKLWDLCTGKVITKWTGHTQGIISVCWDQNTERVVTGSYDGTARVWDVESGMTVLEIKTGLIEVSAAIYSPDMIMIATGGYNLEKEFIKVWDANTGKCLANLQGNTSHVNCLAWTADGGTLVSGSMDCLIKKWNTTTWEQTAALTGHIDTVHAIEISPNGRILASASADHTARLWNLENDQPVGFPLRHANHVNCVSFSTDQNLKLLATGCDDGNSYTWDISAIIRDAGSKEHPHDGGKSSLGADATRHPSQLRENSRRLHPSFFDDPQAHNPERPPARYNTSPRPRFLKIPSFNWSHRRNGEGIELQEHRPVVVDVPLAHGNIRNASAREVRMRKQQRDRRNAANARNAKNASASRSRSSQSRATQQPVESMGAHTPGSHATRSAAPATSAVTTSATSHPQAIIRQPGWWTRLWLFVCCTPVEYTNSHES